MSFVGILQVFDDLSDRRTIAEKKANASLKCNSRCWIRSDDLQAGVRATHQGEQTEYQGYYSYCVLIHQNAQHYRVSCDAVATRRGGCPSRLENLGDEPAWVMTGRWCVAPQVIDRGCYLRPPSLLSSLITCASRVPPGAARGDAAIVRRRQRLQPSLAPEVVAGRLRSVRDRRIRVDDQQSAVRPEIDASQGDAIRFPDLPAHQVDDDELQARGPAAPGGDRELAREVDAGLRDGPANPRPVLPPYRMAVQIEGRLHDLSHLGRMGFEGRQRLDRCPRWHPP